MRTGVERSDLYDPKLNRSYAELAVHYGTLNRPGPGPETSRQAAGRATDAVYPRFVLARAGVHVAAADAAGRAGVVHERRRQTILPAAGRRGTAGGVPRGRGRAAQSLAAAAVRAGHLG